MAEQLTSELDALVDEITRYLSAIDVFRALGCEPSWQPETHRHGLRLERFLSDPREHRAVH